MGKRVSGWLFLVFCLLLVGCTGSAADDDRRGGFYGGVSGDLPSR